MPKLRVQRSPVLMSLCLATLAAISGCGGGSSQPVESPATQAQAAVDPDDAALQHAYQQPSAANGALTATPTPETTVAVVVPVTNVSLPPSTSAEAPAAPAPAPAPAPADEAPTVIAAASGEAMPPAPTTSGTCGADVGNWTVPVPTRLNATVPLRSLNQPGSRLYYVSSARGNDKTADIYFWDGSRIVDSKGSPTDANGAAYGTDPMNPSAAVKAFKRWAYVGPRANPLSDIGTPGAVGSPTPATRAGYPDWWMFARGETFDLFEDLLSFERESNPAATIANGSLNVSGGKSATERQVVGAYGNLCLPRPRFTHPTLGFLTSYTKLGRPALKNVAYLSLHFDGHHQLPVGQYGGITLLYHGAESTNILFEDLWLDAAPVNIGQKSAAQITFRRSLITDAYSKDGKSHVQGFYYEGSREGRLRIEESILLRNGFRGDPKAMAWPPSGDQVWNLYNRNMYFHGEINSMQSGVFDSVSMLGTSGDQFRPGVRLERNFFYQGYVSLGAYGGYADTAGATGSILDNVLQRFVASGTLDNRGQPGWGFSLTSGAYGVEVARNIVTGAQHSANESALDISPLSWPCYAHTYKYATRNNRIHSNIFDTGNAVAGSVSVQHGIAGESPLGCSGVIGSGVTGNQVYGNVLINGQSKTSSLKLLGSLATALTSTDTVYSNNKMFTNRSAAASTLGWTDANRTLKTYLQSRGVTVTSADGFPEYFERATQMRRGQWKPDFTSRAINTYIRAGFGMTAPQ